MKAYAIKVGGAVYWAGANTPEEAIDTLREQSEMGEDLSPGDIEAATCEEIDGSKVFVRDEDGTETTLTQEIEELARPAIVTCSEWDW